MNTSVFADNEGGICVSLDKETIDKAIHRAIEFAKFHNPRWQTFYKRGMTNTKEDWFQAERIGAFGESAFHALTGFPIDEKVREIGNLSDFSTFLPDSTEVKFEAKAALRYPFYEPDWDITRHLDGKAFGHDFFSHKFYIKAQENPTKALIPLRSDYYVFAIIEHAIPNNRNPIEVAVYFYGWITKEDLDKYKEFGPSAKKHAEHRNYFIHVKRLKLMKELLWMFKDQFRNLDASVFI